VEFLMGLPAGWVTDVPGLTRNQKLKVLGNGCVPQQVAAAVRHLFPLLLDQTTEMAA
jgi:DNA (cytosine-5)-methyltransferase 1